MTSLDPQHPESVDIAEIRAHIVKLFDAYLAGDRETLRRGRTSTWKGFQIRSTRLVRGIDEYMDELERVLGGLRVERYELLDVEIELHGDLALVYYVARDWVAPPDATDSDSDLPDTVLIRSLDVYERIDRAWVQTGSNICTIADPSVTARSATATG